MKKNLVDPFGDESKHSEISDCYQVQKTTSITRVLINITANFLTFVVILFDLEDLSMLTVAHEI
jgi:hypothetical protein